MTALRVKRWISNVKPICLFVFYINNEAFAVTSSEITEPLHLYLSLPIFDRMCRWEDYDHNEVISFIGYVTKIQATDASRRAYIIEITTSDDRPISGVIWEKSPAAEIRWQKDSWYEFSDILVKSRNNRLRLSATPQTTVQRVTYEKEAPEPSSTHEPTEIEVTANPLSELYEAFRSIGSAIKAILEHDDTPVSTSNKSEPIVQYYTIIQAIIGDPDHLPDNTSGYGPQQATRTDFQMTEYREVFGNGNLVTEFQCIDVEPLKHRTKERLSKYEIADNPSMVIRPIAPKSEQPIPEYVSDVEELHEALELIAEFPAVPSAPGDEAYSDVSFPIRDIYLSISEEFEGDTTSLDPTELSFANKKSESPSAMKDHFNGTYSIEETLDWLRTESSHEAQIVHERQQLSKEARFIDTVPVSDPVVSAASARGITSLYDHQNKAIEAAKDGDHVVLATETASGKSLPYTLLALERAVEEQLTTLYIAPTKALINDQAKSLRKFASTIPGEYTPSVGVYTGDTPDEVRTQYRLTPPDVLLMTPELVHMSLLPYHNRWNRFLEQLGTIVIDEVHEFRGLFGSHTGLMFRRLNRILVSYNRDPTYFCCSATIGNPIGHASQVTGQPTSQFTLIDNDSSSRGRRFWLLYNPPFKQRDSDAENSDFGDYPEHWDELRQRVYVRDSHQCRSCGKLGGVNGSAELHAHHIVSPANGGAHTLSNLETLCASCHSSEHGRPVGRESYQTEDTQPSVPSEVQAGYERKSNHPLSIRIFTELVARSHQTLVFTGSRQGAARYTTEAANRLERMGLNELASKVMGYHAALSDADREAIEQGLQDGEIRGVWSTNALELGIDVGSIDAITIDGHPGTNMSLFQQTGRGGRGEDDCLILFVARPSPLDQFCISHPSAIFEEPPAEAKINIENTELLQNHVVSAADEKPLRISDEAHFGDTFPTIVSDLTEDQRLIRSTDDRGIHWTSAETNTQYNMTLRGEFGTEYTLIDQTRDAEIGKLSFPDVLRDCHPNAIYNHRKLNYQVEQFDETHNQIILRQNGDESGYTQPLFDQSVTVREVMDTKSLSSNSEVEIGHAKIVYQEDLDGYLRFKYSGDEDPTEHSIEDPLPDYQLRTNGLFITLPSSLEHRMRTMINSQEGVLAGIHAMEHAIRSMFPLSVLCSSNDITGLSAVNHESTNGPTIFILDNVPGGAGLTESGYAQIESILKQTKDLIASCDCASGCPSCIHLESCRSQNRVLNKELAIFALKKLC